MTTQAPDKFQAPALGGATFGRMPDFDHPRVKRTDHPHIPDGYRGFDRFASTACYRRYIATWELRDQSLYLLDVAGYYVIVGESPVPADWYSGWLMVDHGQLVTEDFYPMQPVYEHCTAFEFSHGCLQERTEWRYDSANSRDPFFQLQQFEMSLKR